VIEYLMQKTKLPFLPLILLLGFMTLPVCFSFGIAQQKVLDSLRKEVQSAPPFSETRFNKVMQLAGRYRNLRPTVNIIIEGFDQDYTEYGIRALRWAQQEGTPLQLAQARRFEIDYALYYDYHLDDSSIKFLPLGQNMVNDGVFYSKEDEYYVYRKLVDLYKEKQFFKEFLNLVPRKFELARKLGKPYSENFREYADIGTVYYRQKDYRTAREYYKKTLVSLNKTNENLFKASINNNIALSFSKQGVIDSAIYYYKKSLDIIDSGPSEQYDYKTSEYDEHIKNVVKANIAYLEMRKGKYDEAIDAIKREVHTGKRENEVTTIVQGYNKLGEIYYYKKQYPMALLYLDSAVTAMKPSMHDKDFITNQRQRAKIYLATGKQSIAEQLFAEAKSFEDSIDLVKSKEQIKIASVLYETQAKDEELQQQRLALAKQNEEILRKEKSNIIFSIILVIFGGSLLVFLWVNNKIKSKKEEIEIQKKLVDNSLKEKEILLKEIHHRVKNNLQVVSSLLIKQGNVSNNEHLKKIMEDGQNRIKSMAMVHQLLYQTEDYQNLNLKEYSKLLIRSISSSQQLQGREISTEIQMEDVYAHIDVAVPYGLILNELVSNSFEHGFPEGNSGTISVLLQKKKEGKFDLIVRDNGIGIPNDIDNRQKNSMGINLIKGLAWQLRGSLSYRNTTVGSEFVVTFRNNLNGVT
jgi:two-component sensor histidine kinase